MIQVRQDSFDCIAEYEQIPIEFDIWSRLSIPELRRGRFVELPTDYRRKNYDDIPEERPSALVGRYDTTGWGIWSVYAEEFRCGGAILACSPSDLELLDGRGDLGWIMDVRLHPDSRGCGVGAMLLREMEAWARTRGLRELCVETQDTNVAACKLYARMGYRISHVDAEAYPIALNETQLIWRNLITSLKSRMF